MKELKYWKINFKKIFKQKMEIETYQWVKVDECDIIYFYPVFDDFYDELFDYKSYCTDSNTYTTIDVYSCPCNDCCGCECGLWNCNHHSDYVYTIPIGKYHFLYYYENNLLLKVELYSNNIFTKTLLLNREKLSDDVLLSLSYIEKDKKFGIEYRSYYHEFFDFLIDNFFDKKYLIHK